MASKKPQTSQQSETELSQYQEYIDNVRDAVFTVGFNRSGRYQHQHDCNIEVVGDKHAQNNKDTCGYMQLSGHC